MKIWEEEISGSENVKEWGRAQRGSRVEGTTPRHCSLDAMGSHWK